MMWQSNYLPVLIGISACLFVLVSSQDSPPSIRDYPYFGSIEINEDYACGATIVDDKYVMASNSCIGGVDLKTMSVRVGTSNQGYRGSVYKVVEVNPAVWRGSTADLVMVKVAVSMVFDDHVIPLNPNNNGLTELDNGIIVGWADSQLHVIGGRGWDGLATRREPNTAEKSWTSNIRVNMTRGSPLMLAPVYVLPTPVCARLYEGILNFTNSMFCVWPSTPTSQPCLSSLGSPMYFNEQFYGMVSYNGGCSDPTLPVVVTGISQFTGFIISTLCNMASFF